MDFLDPDCQLEHEQETRSTRYWKERYETLGDYDEAKVKAIHQVYFVTNQLMEIDESQNEEETEVNDECLRQAVEAEDWEYIFTAYKARVYHDETNPTNGMLKKDQKLEEKWRPSNTKEFQGMVNNGLLTEISFETAKSVGITPHVTTRMTKRDKSLKTRISNDGRFEIRRGMFNQTSLHSPAMDEELMKILLHIKAYYNYSMSQSDVTQAFTHNAMSEAEQPRRIVWFLEEVECGIKGGGYFELNAVSYGCADAGKEWYRHISKHINSLGFQTSVYHPCLFYKRLPDETMILIGLDTDNCLQIYPKTELGLQERQKIQDGMSSKWPMTHENGTKQDVLGIEITEEDGIFMRQPATIDSIRKEFFNGKKNEDISNILTPLATNLNKPDDEEEEDQGLKNDYQHKLGILQYIRLTRYDAIPTLSKLAEYTQHPTRRAMRGLTWLAAYIITSADVGLKFQKGPPGAKTTDVLQWIAYGDASWANSGNGYSMYGMAITAVMHHLPEGIFQGAVMGKSSKEKGVPSNSASIAELQAMIKAIDMVLPIRGMSEEIAGVANNETVTDKPEGTAPATAIKLDNASLGIVINTTTSKKSKGMRRVARLIQYVKGLVAQGLIWVDVIQGTKQLANPLTKFFNSPTEHWREVEYLQGTHPAVTQMQAKARALGLARKRQTLKMDTAENSEDEFVYGGNQEAYANMAWNMDQDGSKWRGDQVQLGEQMQEEATPSKRTRNKRRKNKKGVQVIK